MAEGRNSYFDGGVLGWIGTNIVVALMTTFTLGIATPWAVCYSQRWYASHTVYNGKRLVFQGSGGSLFGQYIKWFLLTLITCGIYGFWVALKMQQWTVEHTHFEDGSEGASSFNGTVLGMLGTNILCVLTVMFTLGIGTPWAVARSHRWYKSHSVIDGSQLTFNGTGGSLFGQYIKWFLLTLITCGIYGLWVAVKMQDWVEGNVTI